MITGKGRDHANCKKSVKSTLRGLDWLVRLYTVKGICRYRPTPDRASQGKPEAIYKLLILSDLQKKDGQDQNATKCKYNMIM